MTKNKSIFYIIIFFTLIITAISYRTYFKYATLSWDDYSTIECAPADSSVLQECHAITAYLYEQQKRYHPVRIYSFVVFTRLFNAQSSVYYNFSVHIINILLLFLFLRKFALGNVFSFISVLLFAVFGRARYMDNASTMVGGSGLNLFFILLTFLFLIKSLETNEQRRLKRFAFLGISLLSYTALVFSYEVAIPLFASIVPVFYFFSKGENKGGKGLLAPFRTKKSYYLLLLFLPALIYLVFFRLLVKVHYTGAEIDLSLDILTRLKAYLVYTLRPPVRPILIHAPTMAEFIILALYFGAIVFTLKKTGKGPPDLTDKKRAAARLLLFSVVFYPATVGIYTLNHWLTPTHVMIHHTYLMTAAAALLLSSSFYSFQWALPPSFRKKYLAILIIFVFPIVLINAERHIVRYYQDEAGTVTAIRTLKSALMSNIPDINKTDAIILKNFYYPFYDISSMPGAFLNWFRQGRYIFSGREIISVKDGDIVFKGPLHRYKQPNEEIRAANNRVMIFFVRRKDGYALPYHPVINFEKARNLYQTEQVRGDCPRGKCVDKDRLDAILSNFKTNNYLNINFRSGKDAELFMKNAPLFEINDELVSRGAMRVSGSRLSVDVSDATGRTNYFFLTIISSDKGFKDAIRRIYLTGKIPAKG